MGKNNIELCWKADLDVSEGLPGDIQWDTHFGVPEGDLGLWLRFVEFMGSSWSCGLALCAVRGGPRMTPQATQS